MVDPRLALAASLLLGGCHPRRAEPELDGAWFVRYADDPRPYLDVAFEGEPPTAVRAELEGGGRTWTFDLAWNAADGEWQADCSTLPPITPGVWWIPSVEATLRGGARRRWSAPTPYDGYSPGGEPAGAFYVAAEQGDGVRVRIATDPLQGVPPADTAIFVYAEGDLSRWVAAADDPRTDSPFAVVDAWLGPGRWLVRVDGSENEGGYVVRWDGAESSRDTTPEREPDGPAGPTPMRQGTVYARRVGGGDRSDWFLIDLPAAPSRGQL
jgi:hypothetical protein